MRSSNRDFNVAGRPARLDLPTNHRSPEAGGRYMKWLHGLMLACVAAAALCAGSSHAQVIFHTDFDGPTLDPRISLLPGTTAMFSCGKLIVFLDSPSSGVVIDTEDLPDLRCVFIRWDIEPENFPVGAALNFEIIAPNDLIPGEEYSPVGFALNRPFWDRCVYTLTQDGKDIGKVGFWKSTHSDEECPKMGDLRIDFLPKKENACVEGGEVEERQVIQVELSDGTPLTETQNKKEVDIVRKSGCQYRGAPANAIFHTGDATKEIKITGFQEVPNPREGVAGFAPIVIALDSITIADEHQGSGLPSLQMDPSIFEPGDFVEALLTTEAPFLVPGVTELTMGPDALVQDFQVLSPNQAFAVFQIDPRARHTGHSVELETGEVTITSEYMVNPPDPELPQPPNIVPNIKLVVPPGLQPNVPFIVDTVISDADDQWVQGIMVVLEMPSNNEIYESGFYFPITAGGAEVVNSFQVPGLPAGPYKVVAVVSDGLAPDLYMDVHVFVGQPPPPAGPCEAPGYPNDCCGSPMLVSGDMTLPFNTIGANTDGPQKPNAECGSAKNDTQIWSDLWYLYQPESAGTLTVSTCGFPGEFDTKIAAYTADSTCESGLTILACNEDGPGCAGFGSTLVIPIAEGTPVLIRAGGYLSLSGATSISFTFEPPVPGDAFDDPILLAAGHNAFSTLAATTDGPEHNACDFFGDAQIHNDMWGVWTADFSGPAIFSTCNAAQYDTKIAVYSADPSGKGCPLTDEALLGCDDDGPDGPDADAAGDCAGFTSHLEVDVTAGQNYLIRIGGFSAADSGNGYLFIGPPECGIDTSLADADENEPCLDNSLGTNDGCNLPVPAFAMIESGQTVSGVAWANADGVASPDRDTDWWQVSVSAADDADGDGLVRICHHALGQLPIVSFLIDADPCPATVLGGDIGWSNHCETVQLGSGIVTAPAAGTLNYVVFAGTGTPVGAGVFTGFQCGARNDYLLTVNVVDDDEPCPIGKKPCPADFGGDGNVGPADLAELLASWGSCPGCPADLTGDDIVGPADLAELLASWGTCP